MDLFLDPNIPLFLEPILLWFYPCYHFQAFHLLAYSSSSLHLALMFVYPLHLWVFYQFVILHLLACSSTFLYPYLVFLISSSWFSSSILVSCNTGFTTCIYSFCFSKSISINSSSGLIFYFILSSVVLLIQLSFLNSYFLLSLFQIHHQIHIFVPSNNYYDHHYLCNRNFHLL